VTRKRTHVLVHDLDPDLDPDLDLSVSKCFL
jgi:hypothetical protein